MRIGEFAKKNQVSIDTIRHYMDLDLLLPDKVNGQYSFDIQCQESINEVFLLKEMGFKLSEIKTIFMFNSLGNMTIYQKDEYYKMLFENKYQCVVEEIKKLELTKVKIKSKLKELDECNNKKKFTIGVSLDTLSKLKCLNCKSSLIIKKGDIIDNQILNGLLSCKCGEEYLIQDGIVMISKDKIEDKSHYNHNFITKYISSTDGNYLENIYKGIDWLKRSTAFQELDNKTVLELGSGVGFLLRNIYHLLPDDCLYIAIDHDINKHRLLKNILERSDNKKNILFICSDFKEIPIQEKTIDLLIDYSGTSNYSFAHTEFLLEDINKYVKDQADLIGSYILFKNFASNSLIEDSHRKNFLLNNVKNKLSGLGYKCLQENISDYIEKGGLFENYFVDGEVVYTYQYHGKRLG
ncbi:MerR family transcriptional regulator [Sporosalibacterium faouarense]|uniref:MerR family transcriptional regulator n=1 Tax=Sporosalibacterium faouarense TaxID=516123 RepID=UPI00192B71FA|nr:MerR family transcriptional regulator [Sporosalibacterium faouarense]